MAISKWRYASVEPTLLGIPCIAYTPLFIFMYHISWLTFYIAVGVIVFYGILARLGYPFTVLLNKVLHLLRGSRIYARPWWYRKRFEDR